jgi:hypothetical protein
MGLCALMTTVLAGTAAMAQPAVTASNRNVRAAAHVPRAAAPVQTPAQRRRAATVRRLAALQKAPPRRAICHVFGRRYCSQAIRVARCESRLRTTARNGQYLGLFQMGSSERRLFGHGRSAFEQSKAAHRYFVYSGRDWSPWSCKPWW